MNELFARLNRILIFYKIHWLKLFPHIYVHSLIRALLGFRQTLNNEFEIGVEIMNAEKFIIWWCLSMTWGKTKIGLEGKSEIV